MELEFGTGLYGRWCPADGKATVGLGGLKAPTSVVYPTMAHGLRQGDGHLPSVV